MIPLGRPESEVLEFKSRDALRDLWTISRAVVALLNAQGGEVWLGVREVDGRAAVVAPVEDAARQRERVENHLVDTIEPPPIGGEVRVEVLEDPGPVLRVPVQPAARRGPYAALKDTG